MTTFIVNGVEQTNPISNEGNFVDLIKYIQENLISDNQLVSCMRVNGVEITEKEESALYTIPVSDLDTVEIVLRHPREVAEETLQTLLIFTRRLPSLCKQVADQVEASEGETLFQTLLDHMQIFTDSIQTVKQILHIGINQTINLLEADLGSILKDLLDAHQVGDKLYRAHCFAHPLRPR